ncbi:Hypothetical protein AA314_02553 [Archangium gephyra]|uniref:Uncharacterized protein n=1 Tax=Archangium gephyra TaxID=48 RepID=A0AAC8TCN4_9BACT|nr:Hypothetical protein AA314_02553 [Archangium gephyra]
MTGVLRGVGEAGTHTPRALQQGHPEGTRGLPQKLSRQQRAAGSSTDHQYIPPLLESHIRTVNPGDRSHIPP